jgi:hypothetical protein
MSERFVIEVSSEKAKQLRRIAELTGKSVESLISHDLRPMPPDDSLDEQIERISSYSDAQLWAIVETPVLSDEEVNAWNVLVQRAKAGKALEGDEAKSNEFSELYNKRGLLRSEALVALQERGFDVKGYLKKNAPK